MPRGGAGQLRALLRSLNEDEEKLTTDPRYQEGYDDGYRAAQENYRQLTAALAKVYKIDMDNKF
jgi:flagellar biosynthesis/type III secretory pathway protein FliH